MNRIFMLLCTLFFVSSAFAKALTLYEEPKDTAKVAGTIDSDIGLIPIFSPEKSDWMKVADPRNGQVGWIKTKDLGASNNSEYTFTQRYINTGNAPHSYQIIQFGGPNKMTPEEIQLQIKKNEQQQQLIQENMNKAMQNMVNDMNKLYHWNTEWMNSGLPFVMPVVVIPAPNLPVAKPATPAKAHSKTTEEKKPSH